MPNLTQPKPTLTQFGHARDSQRQKVYTAQRVIENETRKGSPELQDIKACQAWVDRVCQEAWFQRRWGRFRFTVVAGRGGGRANTAMHQISLGTWARQPAVILHEMAHILHLKVYEHRNDAPHGREFCGVFLTLVQFEMGEEARTKLSDSFRAHRVRWTSKAVPAPTRTVVTKAARQAKKVEALTAPPTRRELEQAADVIRRAVRNGTFGPAGRKPRAHALETARLLK